MKPISNIIVYSFFYALLLVFAGVFAEDAGTAFLYFFTVGFLLAASLVFIVVLLKLKGGTLMLMPVVHFILLITMLKRDWDLLFVCVFFVAGFIYCIMVMPEIDKIQAKNK